MPNEFDLIVPKNKKYRGKWLAGPITEIKVVLISFAYEIEYFIILLPNQQLPTLFFRNQC
jgi:hypothetical protein